MRPGDTLAREPWNPDTEDDDCRASGGLHGPPLCLRCLEAPCACAPDDPAMVDPEDEEDALW